MVETRSREPGKANDIVGEEPDAAMQEGMRQPFGGTGRVWFGLCGPIAAPAPGSGLQGGEDPPGRGPESVS